MRKEEMEELFVTGRIEGKRTETTVKCLERERER